MALRTCESPGIAAGIKSLPCSESLLRKKNSMNATSKFLYRDPSEVKPWEETCGQIRPLIEEKDGAAAEIHHVEIDDAKLHYHERTDEFYYVIEGRGTMILDNETVELHQGVVVYVPRGTRHKAIGTLTIRTICIPPGVLDDIHEVE
jgi:mannose-6-phosphate isomerase-like protein (cupin superfamily)